MGLSVIEGAFNQQAANATASVLRKQADLSKRETEADIVRYAAEAQTFKASQKLAYLKSGVTLEGSPLDVLDETARISSENISAMRAKGEATAAALRAKGREVKSAGRAALIGGITKAAQYGIIGGEKAGWFDKGAAKMSRSSFIDDSATAEELGW